MPFGTRRRLRPTFKMIDPVVKARASAGKKLKVISLQGLENTSQREEPKPSAKSFVQPIVQSDKVVRVDSNKLRQQKAAPSVGNPDAPLPTKQDKAAIHNFSAPPKLSAEEDRLLKRVESGDFDLTEAEFVVLDKLQERVNKAPSVVPSKEQKAISKKISKPQAEVLQLITNEVKKNIKDSDKKIARLTKGGMRAKVEQAIKQKEVQLKKLRTLLAKCPTCK